MATRRTTVTADTADLATLQAEARRRQVPLSRVLGEAVQEKADRLREGRRPRVGVAKSDDGAAIRDLADEPVARPFR